MIDRERLDQFLEHVADKFTSAELVDILDVDIHLLISLLEDEIIEQRDKLES